nr:MAG TPA_asm: hypothetical protein [Caudoviricetes sp.]
MIFVTIIYLFGLLFTIFVYKSFIQDNPMFEDGSRVNWLILTIIFLTSPIWLIGLIFHTINCLIHRK